MHFCLIDLQRDYFEEISNDDETHRLTGNNGCASEKLYQLCDATVVPEYRDLVRRFMDVPTLAERLKNEEYISTEYRMCDGSWHSLRFVWLLRVCILLRRRVAGYVPCSRAYCPVCFPSTAYILSFRLYISILYLTKSSLWTILF